MNCVFRVFIEVLKKDLPGFGGTYSLETFFKENENFLLLVYHVYLINNTHEVCLVLDVRL